MASADEEIQTKRASRLILLSVCIGQIIVGLDLRAITVALPTLTTSFHSEFTTIQWTILVYDLVLIGLIITMGRLGDLFGRRKFYSLGFLVFVIASALCGACPDNRATDFLSSRPGHRRLHRSRPMGEPSSR